MKLVGFLHIFLANIVEGVKDNNNENITKDKKSNYVKAAIVYIEKNFSRQLSVREVAGYIGVDRSYLYSLFKEFLNFSPQEYIINLRLDKACQLMENKHLSISDIARSVGYNDPLQFSRIFKRYKRMPPSSYRNNLINRSK